MEYYSSKSRVRKQYRVLTFDSWVKKQKKALPNSDDIRMILWYFKCLTFTQNNLDMDH